MMNKKTLILPFMAIVLALAACASTGTRQSTGEYIDDATITTKVKAQIFGDSDVSASEVNVETYQGVVQLTGFIASRSAMDRAVEIAEGVSGVRSVTNNMKLK